MRFEELSIQRVSGRCLDQGKSSLSCHQWRLRPETASSHCPGGWHEMCAWRSSTSEKSSSVWIFRKLPGAKFEQLRTRLHLVLFHLLVSSGQTRQVLEGLGCCCPLLERSPLNSFWRLDQLLRSWSGSFHVWKRFCVEVIASIFLMFSKEATPSSEDPAKRPEVFFNHPPCSRNYTLL